MLTSRNPVINLLNITIHRQNLRIVPDISAYLMNMQPTKVPSVFALSFRSSVGKVLVAGKLHSSSSS